MPIVSSPAPSPSANPSSASCVAGVQRKILRWLAPSKDDAKSVFKEPKRGPGRPPSAKATDLSEEVNSEEVLHEALLKHTEVLKGLRRLSIIATARFEHHLRHQRFHSRLLHLLLLLLLLWPSPPQPPQL